MTSSTVNVYISLDNTDIRVGNLWLHSRNHHESASFEYDAQWLKHPERFQLEPLLKLSEGIYQTPAGMCVFGSIGDSAPDRWGRTLIRHAAAKNTSDSTPRTLLEADYLLGVNDAARQGALRFSLPTDNSSFLAQPSKNTIPPLVYLPKLLTATQHYLNDAENAEELKLLLAPGSSLGGSRPKASILDQDGQLAIVKFPREDDDTNTVAWEAVALTLAKAAGIRTPDWRLENILEKPVLIIKRFDRLGKQRIPFLSAMSMLSAQDNEHHSYLEIAYAINQYGAVPLQDLHELWRRIVFNIMIANTDDHLRNHGFLYQRHAGWRLSPAYDLNPTPLDIKPRVLTTAIDLDSTTASLEIALSVAQDFRLTPPQAQQITSEVGTAVKQWRQVAKQLNLPKKECDRMASAFEYSKAENRDR